MTEKFVVLAFLISQDFFSNSAIVNCCAWLPGDCSCTVTDVLLSVNCTDRGDVVGLLNQSAIDHPQLRSISVSGALLPSIPSAVCSLDHLDVMQIINSSLQELSPDCFNQMQELQSLIIRHNPLTSLKNGIFDNNPKLDILRMESNAIDTIDPMVFTNKSSLPSVGLIDLRDNKLRKLNEWPLILMLNHQVVISVRSNNIANLTNSLGWRYNCGKGTIKGQLDIKDNQLQRFSELNRKWLSRLTDVLCIFSKDNETRLRVEDNPYHCDCEEYEWVKLLRVFGKKSSIVGQLTCHTPPGLVPGIVDPRVISVDLNALVCVKQCLGKSSKCTEQPHRRTFYIESSEIAHLPESIPPTYWKFDTPYAYHLLFNNSKVTTLEARSYLNQTSLLDLSQSQLVKVETYALQILTHAQVKLNGNQLETLPETTAGMTFRGSLSLHDNPWSCQCSNEWLQRWLQELAINGSLKSPSAILCATPYWLKNTKLLEADFCSVDPAIKKKHLVFTISVSSVACALIILVGSLLMLYKARVWLFVRFHVRLFNEWDDSPDCTDDVFISFAWADYDYAQGIVDMLEEEHGFKCCIHNRDFDPADRFMDQMGKSIDKCRRTLCLLSPHFVQSEYCLWEFSYAFNEDVRRKKKRLAVIMLDPTFELINDDNQIVRQYINTFTYLDSNDPDFTKKLLYIMPETPVTQQRQVSQREDDENCECGDRDALLGEND